MIVNTKYILGKKANSAPSFNESNGSFITKLTDIGNYFNDFRIGKIKYGMPATNADTTHPSISDQTMTSHWSLTTWEENY
jgi:hypothetical protein